MIQLCYKSENDIEVNIFRGSIKTEMIYNEKIRKDLLFDNYIVNDIYTGGHALLPEELFEEYKDEKICYCPCKLNFSLTIYIVFHELSHFNNPYNIEQSERVKWRKGEITSLSKHLRYRIIYTLNEYYAECNEVRKISECKKDFEYKFKELLINIAKKYLNCIPPSNPTSANYTLDSWLDDKKHLIQTNGTINYFKLINVLFSSRFNQFFHFMGFWRGFNEIEENFISQNEWEEFILKFGDDLILSSELLNSLKDLLLNNNKVQLINYLYKTFEAYFNNVFGVKIS